MKIQVGTVSVEMEDRGDRVCWHLASGGSFEPDTLEVWGKLCAGNGGRTVVDIGAYSGLFAIAAALYGCNVHAFEPMPLNRKRVVNNCYLNGEGVRQKIALHQVALSDVPGTMPINYNPATTGLTSGASLVNAKLGNRVSTTIDVQVRTLDSYVLDDVALIKIDVERAEPNVLRGARETLARCKPTLIVEVLGKGEEAAVMAAVDGYKVAERLDTRNWLMVPA